MRDRTVIVGGGVLGTWHALVALERGHDVVHLERDVGPRGASVRNFGLIWVSGRAVGAELALALRARERWGVFGERYGEAGFRANGSLTPVTTPAHVKVLEEVVSRPDASERGVSVLTPAEARRCNPALGGEFLAALHCSLDAAVEPRRVLEALREVCAASGRYQWLPGREVMAYDDHEVQDATGDHHRADLVVLCLGAAHGGVLADALRQAPLRRVRLQMLETARFSGTLTTSIADGDSLRYYPAFDVAARENLERQGSVAARWAAQLLAVQRSHGGLTVGDTHSSTEPFAFDIDDEPSEHLLGALASLLGRPVPPVQRRWAGVYSQMTEDAEGANYLSQPAAPGVVVVTGAGGRGMTLSPAIAEETFA